MSVIHTPEGPMIVAEKCGTCDGTGDETMDSMLAVGVPGGQFPIGPCPDCDGTKYIIPDEVTEFRVGDHVELPSGGVAAYTEGRDIATVVHWGEPDPEGRRLCVETPWDAMWVRYFPLELTNLEPGRVFVPDPAAEPVPVVQIGDEPSEGPWIVTFGSLATLIDANGFATRLDADLTVGQALIRAVPT